MLFSIIGIAAFVYPVWGFALILAFCSMTTAVDFAVDGSSMQTVVDIVEGLLPCRCGGCAASAFPPFA